MATTPKISINVQIKNLLAKLEKAPKTFERSVVGEVYTSAHQIRAYARHLAPYRTGLLRNSIEVRMMDGGRAAFIGTRVGYARLQKPFLKPAWKKERPQFVQRLSKKLAEAVR